MARVTSYSGDRPCSRNGITCSSAPDVNATARNTASSSPADGVRSRHEPRHDAEPLTRAPRCIGDTGRLGHDDLRAAARQRLDVAQRAEQALALLDVLLRHVGADERLDQHRAVVGQRRDQAARLRAERVDTLRRRVEPQVRARHQHSGGAPAPRRHATARTATCAFSGSPVAPRSTAHVETEEQRRETREVDDGAGADDRPARTR